MAVDRPSPPVPAGLPNVVDECPFALKTGHPSWPISVAFLAICGYAGYLGAIGWVEQKKNYDDLMTQIDAVGADLTRAWQMAENATVSVVSSSCDQIMSAVTSEIAPFADMTASFAHDVSAKALAYESMLTALACTPVLIEQLEANNEYNAELKQKVGVVQAEACPALKRDPVTGVYSGVLKWVELPDVCSKGRR